MAAGTAPYLLFVDASWQPGDPVRVPESRAIQLAPGLGFTAVLIRVLDDGAAIAFAEARVSSIGETANQTGAALSLRSLRLAREPQQIRTSDEAAEVLDQLDFEEPTPRGLGELAQEDFAGIDQTLALAALNANQWRCQVTGWPIAQSVQAENHVTLIVPEAFDGLIRSDNLLTLSAEAMEAWREGLISVDPDWSMVANLGRLSGYFKPHIASHLSVPSERFRPNPIYLRLHRYRIFDRVPPLR